MIDKSLLGYRKYVLEEFEFENGQVLRDVEVEYTTRRTPIYDENGNVVGKPEYTSNYSDATYQIVGTTEADPRKGKISNESPIGAALMGHKAGEKVDVHTPGGLLELEIVCINA